MEAIAQKYHSFSTVAIFGTAGEPAEADVSLSNFRGYSWQWFGRYWTGESLTGPRTHVHLLIWRKAFRMCQVKARVEKLMRKFILTTLAAISLTAGGVLYADRAQAAPLFDGLQGAVPASNIENVQFPLPFLSRFFGGHRYCWYWDGWNGPGWYWCGYRWRRNFGWGGAEEWHGWNAPGRHVAPSFRRAPHGTAYRGPSGPAYRAPSGPAFRGPTNPGGHGPSFSHGPSGHGPSGRAPSGPRPKGPGGHGPKGH
jgi:hypothetical protein